jgi:hypothetical protein
MTSEKKHSVALMGAFIFGCVLAAYFWQADRAASSALVAATLQPMERLVAEHQKLDDELSKDPFTEPNRNVFGAYLTKIRRNGLPKNADMKQRLDALANDNAALAAMVTAYAPIARTEHFKAEADHFRTYEVAWRDRWNSLMELFMGGGEYPVSATPYPPAFPAALDEELAAAK